MDAHVHVHALVPGGGPSLDGRRWIRSRHKVQRRRRKPFLVDNKLLSHEFRKEFIAGLKRLHRRGEIHFTPPVLPGEHEPDFTEWVDGLADEWNVYIEPPPQPGVSAEDGAEHVVKYLARYMTGGPISDRRLISHEKREVTFWARSKNKKKGNKPRPFTLPGREFVRRWAMHILPMEIGM